MSDRPVLYVPGANAQSVAELGLLLMLSLARWPGWRAAWAWT